VTTHRARGIASEQGWIEPGKKTKQEANLIPRRLVDNFGRPEQVIYTRGEALQVLGVSEPALESIVNANVLLRLPNDHDGRSVSMYQKCEVDGLVERLQQIAEEGSGSMGENAIDLHKLMCEIAPPRHNFGFLLKKVFEGTLKPIGWDRSVRGIYAMKFDANRIIEYRTAVNATLPAAIRVTRATRRFGFSKAELAWLVNERLVRITKPADTFRGSYLNRADLEAFTRTHVMENKIDMKDLSEDATVVVDSPKFGRIFRI